MVGLPRRADRFAPIGQLLPDIPNPPLRVVVLRLYGMALHLRSAISSRSTNESYRPESAFAEDPNIAGGMPPAFRNNLLPTGCDNPASSAASSLPAPRQSPATIYSVHRALQQTAVLAMAMGLVLAAPTGALQRSSQPPTSGCCDDRLNSPNPLSTPSAWLKLASSLLSIGPLIAD
ncbi:hypothetical protein [Bradyrhizobium sp. 162]|uniref:hypothetical protein n=1 Tax=Bradyrhizobium sp. 162 TaxID=2782635 RepID=UPI001FF7FC2F|nr:hypothetical protein [Bradyrhizobium sp. 162]MCK1629023.1 hypothetical protein [Bradyrhizobium sp. 162]